MNKYSFKDILEKEITIVTETNQNSTILLKRIEIPKIQRDYAQGRLQESEVRKRFLDNIFKTLLKTDDTPMEMDFVYGSIDEKTKKLTLLDGQQRLTTLFLLCWYIGMQELNNSELHDLKNSLNKFTYETRPSSREFCQNLNKAETVINFDDLPSKKITNLPWFYKSYKQDPTIQSMLNMLDAIHEKYIHENQKLFDKLQRLQFYILPLNGFNLTDELYVKMNARGKQLTDFENFKADLIKWMKDECNTEFKIFVNKIKLNGREMPYYLSLSQKIDTTWTDYFWQETKNYDPKEKDKKGNLIHPEGKNVDTLFFQLFCRFFFSKLVVDETQFSSNILSILSENELNEKYKYFIAKNTKYQHNGSISEFKANLKENLDVKQDFVKFIFDIL